MQESRSKIKKVEKDSGVLNDIEKYFNVILRIIPSNAGAYKFNKLKLYSDDLDYLHSLRDKGYYSYVRRSGKGLLIIISDEKLNE